VILHAEMVFVSTDHICGSICSTIQVLPVMTYAQKGLGGILYTRYIKLFSSIGYLELDWSILRITTFKYSLHKFSETILNSTQK